MKRAIIAVVLAAAVAAGAFILYRISKPPRLNVVLLSIDTLRPDHLGCYGYGRSTSPRIDRLAKEGTLFKTAVSSTSWTLPAHHALLTSLPDPAHGVIWDDNRLDDSRVTMAEIFKENGYATAGFFTGPYLLPRFGFSQGFDDYMDATLYDKKLEGPDVLVASERGRTTPGAMKMLKKWLSGISGKPFFIFLHLFDVHPDFDPPPPYDTMFDSGYSGSIKGSDVFHNPNINKYMDKRDLDHLISLYDGEIRFVDEKGINRLLKILENKEVLDDTLIVITADHGEEFFEHGDFAHRKNLYDTTLLIPLILWKPGLVPKGLEVDRQVSIIDVMPTVLDLAGLPRSPEGTGRSLVPDLKGEQQPVSAGTHSELTGGDIHLESLRTEEFKIILDYKKETISGFNLIDDPGETNPVTDRSDGLISTALERFLGLRGAILELRRSLPKSGGQTPPMSEEMRERLESLGYINK